MHAHGPAPPAHLFFTTMRQERCWYSHSIVEKTGAQKGEVPRSKSPWIRTQDYRTPEPQAACTQTHTLTQTIPSFSSLPQFLTSFLTPLSPRFLISFLLQAIGHAICTYSLKQRPNNHSIAKVYRLSPGSPLGTIMFTFTSLG